MRQVGQGSEMHQWAMRLRANFDMQLWASVYPHAASQPEIAPSSRETGSMVPRRDIRTSTRMLAVPVAMKRRVRSQLMRIPVPDPAARLYNWLAAHMADEWLVALLAAVLSISFFAWYASHGYTVAFNDARIRAMIGRRVVVSRTPGLAQLGVTWLPLDFILMLPLIWNDTLFRDGVAASLPSMLAYVMASIYMYRMGRHAASSRGAGWIAAAVLALNPSLLYMQSTAMSETASVSAIVISTYYALHLMRSYHAADLLKCAAAVTAGTLIRYENWVLAFALVPILAYAGWRHRGYMMAEAWTILYGLLAFAGCAAWVIYNTVIFHDPLLSFFYGQTSHTYYATTSDAALPARHHPWVALEMYSYNVIETVGWTVAAMALLGLIVFVLRVRLRLTILPAYLTLVPFGFYWLVLYRGINTENLPELGMGRYYNIRFGLLTIPAVALFAAFLAAALPSRRHLLAIAALAVIMVSSIMNTTVQTPYVLREALYGAGSDGRLTGQMQAQWLGSHYRGGNVLITYVNDPSMMFFLLTKYDFPDRALITDSSRWQFTDALEHPETAVTWIVMNSDTTNGDSKIWTTLSRQQGWRHFFVLRKVFGTTQIYEHIGVTETGDAGQRGSDGSQAVAPFPSLLDQDLPMLHPFWSRRMTPARVRQGEASSFP